ncbi:MAG: SDR family oxidoreductase [Saprospiraceae bacterium]|nr:SDR family oxidoreductase [Saprospiraceae bacterium]MDZ4702354.1 SDR family oxidoreductase [Saprospiraceae bacterium]
MNLDLSGKNALVCGSSKGLGKATAIELAKLGANITLVARSANIMAELIHQLDRSPGQTHDFLAADFTNRADLKRKVTGLITVKTIHILINNTGGPPAGTIAESAEDAFLEAFQNHLICNQLLTQQVVPGMKAAGYGRIINIVSTSVKQPLEGLGVSNTVRAAVAGWAKTWSNELAPFGITMNNVLPGATDTDRLRDLINNKATKLGVSEAEIIQEMQAEIPMGRFAEASEIAAVVAFLATPAAGYLTGVSIPVDGGRIKGL